MVPEHDSQLVVNLSIIHIDSENDSPDKNDQARARVTIPIKRTRTNSSKKYTATENSPQMFSKLKRAARGSPVAKQNHHNDLNLKKDQFNTIFVKIWRLLINEVTRKQPSSE